MTGGQTNTFAQMLKNYRRAAGLSQAALAERAHLSRDGVSALERGVSRTPRGDTIHLLLDALRLSSTEQDQLLAAAQQRQPAPPSPRHNSQHARFVSLPTPLTSLVGRDQEIAAVRQLVCREDVRLVTLTGAPGIGKTRLAIAVAATVAGVCPDGAVFIPLATIREPALLLATIARAVSLREANEQALTERLAPELSGLSLVLVLDGFEHMLNAAPALADLLVACPRVKALVTSRAALRVSGEHEFPVAPLPAPDAMDLFVCRAAAVQPEFTLAPQNAPVVEQITRRLDGLPLAIELAAARIKLLPPATLLAHLAPALPLLTRGGQDLPERQHTMRGAIAWSYDLLDARMQRFFRSVAIFAGGWTLDAAERVCCDSASDVLDALATLMDQSLVARVAVDSHKPRYRLLSTLREFGLERLAESGEAENMASRHARYYVELAESWDSHAPGQQVGPSLFALEDERNNFNAALRWALSAGNLEIAGRLVAALSRFWWLRGYVIEGRAWLDETLKAFRSASGRLAASDVAAARAKLARATALLTTLHDTADSTPSIAGESVEFAHATGDGWRLA